MDEKQKLESRILCLDLAVTICKETGNTEAVVSEAEKYWQWLNSNIVPQDTSGDGIPF